jgi:DNA polymerase lambda
MEIIETGALRRVDAERTEDVPVVQLFQGIYGVGMYRCGFSLDLRSSSLPPLFPQGQSTAYAWYFSGCRTLEDIKERKGGIELSQAQVLGLKYYDGAPSHLMRWLVI